MKVNKRDIIAALVLGVGVGLLLQPIISNFGISIQHRISIPLILVRFVVFAVVAIGCPLIIALISQFLPMLYQFGKFASVGILNTSIDLGVFNLETFLWSVLPTTFVFTIFKTISFLVATTNSFLWNKYWTFETKAKPHPGEVLKFYSVAIIGGLLNIGIATLMKIALGGFVSANALVNLVAPISGILSAFLWDFFGYKYLVFKKVDSDSHPGGQS